MRTKSPYAIKRIGNNVVANKEWDESKTGIMRDILLHKFASSQQLQKVLRGTGNKPLLEATTDKFWGAGVPLHKIEFHMKSLPGGNVLGRLLEELRSNLPQSL